jgi:hypothetical protein
MWSSGPERWWLTLVVAAAAPAKSTETSRKCHSFGASLERFFLTEARCALRARVQSFRGQNQLKPGREYPGNHHHRRIRSFPARNHDGVGIRKRSTTRGQSNDRNVRYATILPVRLVPRLRETSPQPPSFRQRIAAVQERDECLCGFLPSSLPIFVTMRGC